MLKSSFLIRLTVLQFYIQAFLLYKPGIMQRPIFFRIGELNLDLLAASKYINRQGTDLENQQKLWDKLIHL